MAQLDRAAPAALFGFSRKDHERAGRRAVQYKPSRAQRWR